MSVGCQTYKLTFPVFLQQVYFQEKELNRIIQYFIIYKKNV